MFVPFLSHIHLALVFIICSGALGHKSFSSLPVEDTFIPHAFIQTGEELHYFTDIDDQEIVFTTFAPEHTEKPEYNILTDKDVKLEPEEINFEQTSVGIPLKHHVTITNRMKKDLYFLAIGSTSMSFHSSFPKDALLPEDASTTVTIFFLPPDIGEFENKLTIITSNGVIHYPVKGIATESPYRIQAISGVKVPVNGTFMSPIKIHNPHSTTLTVNEAASSSTRVHFEISELEELRDDTYWEIAPYQTRTIGYVRIVGAEETNMTSYISLKLKLKESPQASEALNINRQQPPPPSLLFIPIDFKVLRHRSIYSVKNNFDFGLIKLGEKSEQLVVDVLSTVEKSIDIESIYVDKSDFTHGVYFEFASKPPISVKGGTQNGPGPPVSLAKVSVDSNYVIRQNNEQTNSNEAQLVHINGKIIAESRGGNYNVSVPYKASVYSGSLSHDLEDIAFYHKLKTPVHRTVSFTNNLPFGVVIYNISMASNASGIFKGTLITPTIKIAPKERKEILVLEYLTSQPLTYTTSFTLQTNVSTFEYPILMFNGDVKVLIHALEKDQFDFGAVEFHKERSIYFAVINENPVQMILKNLQQPFSPFSKLQLLGIEAGNNTKLSTFAEHKTSLWKSGKDFVIPNKSFAVFKFSIIGNPLITRQNSNFIIQTEFSQYQFPVTFSLTNYSLYSVPQIIDFGEVFPTMISTKEIKLLSTFPEEMLVNRLSLRSSDLRFYFQKVDPQLQPRITSNNISTIATVLLKPETAPANEQYVGMPFTSHDGQWFAYAMKFPANLAEIDSYLYRRLRKRYNYMVSRGQHIINTSIIVDTPTVKNMEIPAKAELVWPKLLSHTVVHFPLTAVGNFTILNLTLTNPSSRPVIVQLLPLVIYPDAESFLEFFKDEFPAPLLEPVETNETLMFSLRDTELFTLKPNSPVPKLREEVEKVVGSNIPRFTLSMVLQPKMKTRIRIGFLPTDYDLHSSLLIIRNNLTVIEPVVLYGQGARIDVRVENKTTRAEPSLFDIQPIHLKDCFNPKRQMHKLSTTLTVKRPFEVVNTGEVAFTVSNMTINNIPCENRGFHIINCHPFHLSPGDSHVLEIAYTPDFLMSINEASLQLYMHMNGTPWVFYIGATIPQQMLSMCHSALPRPPFENFMYYSCIIALIFCLICVMACSYLEGDRLINYTIRQDVSLITRRSCSVSENGQLEQPPIPSQSRRRPSHYRNHVQVGQNSMFIVRWFCSAANLFLWLFSFVWMAVRSEPEVTEATRKKKNKKQKPVAMPPPLKENTLQPPIKSKNEYSNTKSENNLPAPEKLKNNDKNISKDMELRLRKITTKIDEEQNKAETKNGKISNNQKKQKNKSPKPKKQIEKVPSDPEPVSSDNKMKKSNEALKVPLSESINDNEIDKTDLPVPQIDSLSLPSEENEQEQIEKDVDDNLSEDSAEPEWADEQVDGDNYDADFADMVQATAETFSSRADTPASSSSHSSAPPPSSSRNQRKLMRRSESELTTDETDTSHVGPGRARKFKPSKERKSKVLFYFLLDVHVLTHVEPVIVVLVSIISYP
uniref:Transmembrane protein 131 n=1 Tax=Panagrolaimus superbus TaxID=310955 RepID=A0A914YUI0_9BILA